MRIRWFPVEAERLAQLLLHDDRVAIYVPHASLPTIGISLVIRRSLGLEAILRICFTAAACTTRKRAMWVVMRGIPPKDDLDNDYEDAAISRNISPDMYSLGAPKRADV